MACANRRFSLRVYKSVRSWRGSLNLWAPASAAVHTPLGASAPESALVRRYGQVPLVVSLLVRSVLTPPEATLAYPTLARILGRRPKRVAALHTRLHPLEGDKRYSAERAFLYFRPLYFREKSRVGLPEN